MHALVHFSLCSTGFHIWFEESIANCFVIYLLDFTSKINEVFYGGKKHYTQEM